MKRRGFIASLLGLLGIGSVAPLPAQSYTTELQPDKLIRSNGYRLRLWKLGSLEHKMFPTGKAMQKLADCLSQLSEDGGDLIWEPDLTCEEFCGNNAVNIIAPPSVTITKMSDGNLKISIDNRDEV